MTRGRIVSSRVMVGLEIHVELATSTKMFTRCPSPAHALHESAAPNALIDPVVLGLPGALSVMNRSAVEMSIRVGLALGCQIATQSRWDRKSYFYPDMPKNYQISQYPLPLCFDGSVELPPIKDGRVDLEALARSPEAQVGKRIGIIRAHLEEDAGKLLHELPGGHAIEGSIVDFNRAGTPLLEIVTQPDFSSADEAVVFCQMLRTTCRYLCVSACVMQKGHIRFEPNINCVLTLDDGRLVRTPIVEVKNLNSFRSVRGAIEFEAVDQPRRWLEDGREMAPGTKSTRGWDDHASVTIPQREKEEADDYRYFPDPDLPPVAVDAELVQSLRAGLPEPALTRARRYMNATGLSASEAMMLAEEREVSDLYEQATTKAEALGIDRARAERTSANLLLQSGAKRANERSTHENPVLISDLGITAEQLGELVAMRERGELSAKGADELFELLCTHAGATAAELAKAHGLVLVRDDRALDGWIDQVLGANVKVVADVQAGKVQAAGRLVGEVMKLASASGSAVDAKTVRERVLARIGVSAT